MDHKLLYLVAYNKMLSISIDAGDIISYRDHIINYINGLNITVDERKAAQCDQYGPNNTSIFCYYEVKNQVVYMLIYQGTRHQFSMSCVTRIINDFSACMHDKATNISWLKTEFDRIFAFHNDAKNDALNQLYVQVEEATNVMKSNISLALSREENFDHLVTKTDELEQKAILFKDKTSSIKQKMCMENLKATACMAIVILCVIAFLVGVGWIIYRVIVV